MTVRPIPPDTIRQWTEGLLANSGVRQNVRRYVVETPKDCLVDAAEQLRGFTKPTTVVWSTNNRTMPRALVGRI